jgi:hypothetical protein
MAENELNHLLLCVEIGEMTDIEDSIIAEGAASYFSFMYWPTLQHISTGASEVCIVFQMSMDDCWSMSIFGVFEMVLLPPWTGKKLAFIKGATGGLIFQV